MVLINTDSIEIDKGAWGRPTKATIQVITRLISLIKIDATVWEACAYAKIHYNTFYNWYWSDTEFLWEYEEVDPADPDGKRTLIVQEQCTFRELIDQARARKYILAKKNLFKAMQSWDTKATIEFLKRRSADYFDKQVTIPWEEDVVSETIKSLKDAKARKLGRTGSEAEPQQEGAEGWDN